MHDNIIAEYLFRIILVRGNRQSILVLYLIIGNCTFSREIIDLCIKERICQKWLSMFYAFWKCIITKISNFISNYYTALQTHNKQKLKILRRLKMLFFGWDFLCSLLSSINWFDRRKTMQNIKCVVVGTDKLFYIILFWLND